MKPKRELIRVVRTPEGDVVLDPSGKRNGRGAYICPKQGCLEQAIKGKRFERAFEHQIPAEVYAALRTQLGGL